jgi:NhaA family Na+:H+ antiporter
MSRSARQRGQLSAQADRSPFVRRIGLPVQRFISTEAASGVVLLAAVVLALLWANSPWAASYEALWATPITVTVGGFGVDKPLGLWVNDGLMAIFFFVVGLEIKRELLHGELSSPRKAALPIAAAIGGMAVPAAIYVTVNGLGEAARGWAIPMATDIALALGILALLGSRIPAELRVFLLALAIVDDIGAIAVIAIFFSSGIDLTAIIAAASIFVVLLAAVRFGVRSPVFFVVLAILFWVAVLKSGVHATIAGVLLAIVVPSRPAVGPDRVAEAIGGFLDRLEHAAGDEDEELGRIQAIVTDTEAPLERYVRMLHPWVSYGIVPIFALANAGLVISTDRFVAAAGSGITLGIVLGLVLGKPVGILLASRIVTALGLAHLPNGVTWTHLTGVGLLAGIGFTVALFIAELAFSDPTSLDLSKAGILVASIVAGLAGYGTLRVVTR